MRIAITGMSGSLGTALTARLVSAGIVPIVGITRDELRAEQISNQYGGIQGDVRVMVVGEGIIDQAKLAEVFRGCEVVVHAAAFKRIGGSVYAAEEMVETNVRGTLSVLKAATAAGVQKVLFVSSDKAVQATNLYGATKFIGECLAIQENSFSYPRGTRISACRYGNVLGSRGSVVGIWREAVAKCEPLRVTHQDMTRFIITMEQAVDFVLASIFSMHGGEIFVPILPSAKMIDLARAIVGRNALMIEGEAGQIQVDNQLRPGGEKLAESLLSEEEPVRTVKRQLHGGFSGPIDAYVVVPSHRSWSTQNYPGEKVRPDLVYRSDVNDRWLTVPELQTMLKDVP